MADVYNMTGFRTSQTVADVVVWANSVTGNLLVGGFMLAFSIIMTTALLRRYNMVESLAVTGYVCFFISIWLRFAGLVNFEFLLVYGTIMSVSTMILVIKRF